MEDNWSWILSMSTNSIIIFIILSSVTRVSANTNNDIRIQGYNEHPIYRMTHYDLHTVHHGCRSAGISLEGKGLTGWSNSRHCVLTRLTDITVEQFLEVRARAGALLLLLPENLSNLSSIEREHIAILENAMAVQDVPIPVYFVPYSDDMNSIVDDLSSGFSSDDKHGSATDALFNVASANGYQIVVTSAAVNKQDSKVATFHGQLLGQDKSANRESGKIPTVAIVAHYDSAAVAPELANGADANASGVSILLELARIFSQLYSSASTRGRVNIVFLLTGAARMNYYSTKKWIEDQLDTGEGSVLQDVSFVICLDSLASADSLIMHVSKPPKEGSATNIFYKQMKHVASLYGLENNVDGVHKKINLADENLAWEHERFSIRRLPAFTLSASKNHKMPSRSSLLDTKESASLDSLYINTQIIAQSLASYLYNVSTNDFNDIFANSLKVDKNALGSWMKFLTNQPRATQFVSQTQNPMLSTLSDALSKYVPDVVTSYYSPDKRDPEFVTYMPTSAILNIYNVKPAVFDLILTVIIAAYLGLVYLLIFKFPTIYSFVCKLSVEGSSKYKYQ